MRWTTEVVLVMLTCGAIFAVLGSSFSPLSWAVASLCAWCSVLIVRPWHSMDAWEQRVLLWAIISVAAFAHFLASDPTFQNWSDVYFFCGRDMRYCTATFHWNVNGWRKAFVLWNFCLSTALAAQRLAVEIGLNGFLAGEDAVARESFISIAWRLIPFFLNRWESSFGAECSSILFELPHFALELLVVLPLVQIMAGRLRIVGHPHIRIARNSRGQGVQGRDEAIAPDVLNCGWIRDSSQRKLVPRLKANIRPMAVIVFITSLAAYNALVIPLALEKQTAGADKALMIGGLRNELNSIVSAGVRADRLFKSIVKNHSKESGKESYLMDTNEAFLQALETRNRSNVARMGKRNSIGCIRAGNCTSLGSLGPQLMETIHNHLNDKINSKNNIKNSNSGNADLLVPVHWAMELLESRDGDSDTNGGGANVLSARVLAALLFDAKHDIFLDNQFLSKSSGERVENTMEDTIIVAVREVQRAHLLKATQTTQAGTGSYQHRSIAKLYKNLNKHATELHRMQDPEHKMVVPLVEVALAIMRLSCERWFALLAVYVGYLVFRDPPPAAQSAIKWVALLSRIFQRAILLSFPGVCWVYGAGIVFSTFVSAIFWVGPLMRALEKVRTAVAHVEPQHWHAATAEEVERMGGTCAICWGTIDINQGDDRSRGRESSQLETGEMCAGLPCGHAYHRNCLAEWLQSCFAQSRKATCPMCQTDIPLKVRYRVSLKKTRINQSDSENHNDGAITRATAEEHDGAAHHREPGIPGLDALVDDLVDDFRHRFDLPVGPLVWAAPEDDHGRRQPGNVGQEANGQNEAGAGAGPNEVAQPMDIAERRIEGRGRRRGWFRFLRRGTRRLENGDNHYNGAYNNNNNNNYNHNGDHDQMVAQQNR